MKKHGKNGMSTEEYLSFLEREEHRSRLLAEYANTPEEREAAKKQNERIKRSLKRMRKLSGTKIETADLKMNLDEEDVD